MTELKTLKDIEMIKKGLAPDPMIVEQANKWWDKLKDWQKQTIFMER